MRFVIHDIGDNQKALKKLTTSQSQLVNLENAFPLEE